LSRVFSEKADALVGALPQTPQAFGKRLDLNLILILVRFEIISVSKRLFDIADFLYYAVADGIFEVLKFVKRSISSFLVPPLNDGQLRFAPWAA